MNEQTTQVDMIRWMHPFADQIILLSIFVALVSVIIFIAKKGKRPFSVRLLSRNIKFNLIVAGITFLSKVLKFSEMAATNMEFSREGSMNLCFADFSEIVMNPLTILFFTAFLFILKFLLSCPGEFKNTNMMPRINEVEPQGTRALSDVRC